MSHRKISILIPDAANYLLLHVLNCLADNGNFLIFLILYENSGTKYSRYVTSCSTYPKTEDSMKRIENINAAVLKHNIDIIMPIHDHSVNDLVRFRKYIQFPEKLIQLPSVAAYKIATNKALLAFHLKNNDLPSPRSLVFNRGDTISSLSYDFPFIIKPTTNSHGGYGVKLIESEVSFVNYLKTYTLHDEFLVQNEFKGEDWGCSILALNGSLKAYCFQRTTMHQRNKFAPAIGIELIQETKPLQAVEKLIKSLGWSGVAHIDLRYNREEDKFVIIEMNARYWASIEASKVGGVNFPQLHLQLSMGDDFPFPTYNSIEYLKFQGVALRLKKNIGFLFNFRFLFSKTEFSSIWKDPVPMIFRVFAKIKRNFGNPKK